MGYKRKLNRYVLDLRRDGLSLPHIARVYGTSTVAVYNYIKRRVPALATRRKMTGRCEICGTAGHVQSDHNHETGKNRCILCPRCNQGLGYFKESPVLLRRAADYVENKSLDKVAGL